MTLRVGIVAGEVSGDHLGAGLIHALRQQHPDIIFEGIGGPRMIEAGCRSLFSIERLSVMGLVEVVKRLPELFFLRQQIVKHFLKNPPDVFIGLDAPDFNLSIERSLKKAGIFTVHYTSPTLWAWRPNRIHTIAKSVNLMLTLFPFERALYEKHGVPVSFVGHPMADEIPDTVNRSQARQKLGLPIDAEIIALLPGSRAAEIDQHGKLFAQTASWCLSQRPGLVFVVPMVNDARSRQFKKVLQELSLGLPIHIVEGQSQQVMAAADVVLSASGTATLETALLKRPLVVAHRVSPLTYYLAKRLIKIPHIALPNILLGKSIVPEFIQSAAIPANIGKSLLEYLHNPALQQSITHDYQQLHHQLRQNASFKASEAILKAIS